MTTDKKSRGMPARSAQEIAALPEAWLTPEEAGAYIGLSPLALNQRRHVGMGPPYVKQGRTIRYAKQAIDAWLTGKA